MKKPFQTLLLFGAPGSGKGTQGKALGTLPGFFHCACGEVFRSLDVQSPLGQEFLKYSSKGNLVPNRVTVDLWLQWIERMADTGTFKPEQDLLILDGIPRNVEQAELMSELIEVKYIAHLTCPDRDKIVHRLKKRALKENRLDDANEEIIRHRLATYEKESKPLLDFYPTGLIHQIDASLSPVEVLDKIISVVLEKTP